MNNSHKAVFVSLFILFSLYILPFVLFDLPYRDDIVRSISGQGWLHDGRLFADLMSRILSLGSFSLDLFPLMQLLSIPCLTFAAYGLYRYFLSSTFSLLGVFLIFLVFGHPLYLENLSFHYDAFFMSLALLLVTSSFLSLRNLSWKSFIRGGLILICALLFYEPVLMFFVGLSLIDVWYGFWQRKEKPREILVSLCIKASLFIGVYIIFSVITNPFIQGWALSHRGWIFFANEEDWEHYKAFWHQIGVIGRSFLFSKGGVLAFIVFFLLLTYLWIRRAISVWENRNSHSSFASFCVFSLILFLPFLILIFPFLPLILLKNPVITPRMLLSLGLIFLLSFSYPFRKLEGFSLSRFLIVSLVLLFLSFSYIYNQGRKIDEEFQNSLTLNVIHQLKYWGVMNNIRDILFIGHQPQDPRVSTLLRIIPIFRPMFPQYLDEKTSRRWVYLYCQHYPILNLKENLTEKEEQYRKSLKAKGHVLPLFYTQSNSPYQLSISKTLAVVYWK